MLGFVGQDAKGLAGLEFSFEDELAGEPGWSRASATPVGKEIAGGQRVLVQPQQGADLVLTIDRVVQRLAERTLADAVAANKSVGGLILVMEPSTGAILAMANWPTYNLTGDVSTRPIRRRSTRPSRSPTSTSPARS